MAHGALQRRLQAERRCTSRGARGDTIGRRIRTALVAALVAAVGKGGGLGLGGWGGGRRGSTIKKLVVHSLGAADAVAVLDIIALGFAGKPRRHDCVVFVCVWVGGLVVEKRKTSCLSQSRSRLTTRDASKQETAVVVTILIFLFASSRPYILPPPFNARLNFGLNYSNTYPNTSSSGIS